jgi:non-ribosomal peptide synthetase component F
MRVKLRLEFDAEPAGLEIPEGGQPGGYVNLRENPAAIEQIEPARLHRPLRGMLMALNSAESEFASVACRTWTKENPAAAEASEFGSSVDVIFSWQKHNFERSTYVSLAEGLRELLERESGADTLAAEVSVLRCEYQGSRSQGYALRLMLVGRGGTLEQAELRWGLGVAHLQQALLFLSRAVKQQKARAN